MQKVILSLAGIGSLLLASGSSAVESRRYRYSFSVSYPAGFKGAGRCNIESTGARLASHDLYSAQDQKFQGTVVAPEGPLELHCFMPGYEAIHSGFRQAGDFLSSAVSFTTPSLFQEHPMGATQTRIQINPPKFQIVKNAAGFDQLVAPAHPRIFFKPTVPGGPLIPTVNVRVALPIGAEVTQVKVIPGAATITNNVRLAGPNIQQPVTEFPDIGQPMLRFRAFIPSFAIRPENILGQGADHDRRFNTYVVSIPLIGYNAQKMQLETYNDIRLGVSFSGGDDCFSRVPNVIRDEVDLFLAKEISGPAMFIANPQVTLKACDQEGEGRPGEIINPEERLPRLMAFVNRAASPAQLLIVTAPKMAAVAREIAEYKRDRGIETAILTTEGESDAQIKARIQAAHIPADVREVQALKWILLLGDTDTVPVHYQSDLPNLQDRVPNAGDIYYGQFPKDGVYRPDVTPIVSVGRIPAKNPEEARVVLKKIQAYESSPTTADHFYRSPALAGNLTLAEGKANHLSYAGNIEWNAADLFQTRLLRPQRIFKQTTVGATPTLWTNAQPLNLTELADDLSGLTPRNLFRLDGSQQNLDEAVNRGAALLWHRGHGNTNVLQAPDFKWREGAWKITGNAYPLMLSLNCLAGHYDNESVKSHLAPGDNFSVFSRETPEQRFLGETVALSASGAIGFIGANRTSPTIENDLMTAPLADAFSPEDSDDAQGKSARIGDLLASVKSTLITGNKNPDPRNIQANTLNYNLLGDPTVQLRLHRPYEVIRHDIAEDGNGVTLTFDVRIAGCEGCSDPGNRAAPIVVARGFDNEMIARAVGEFDGTKFVARFPGVDQSRVMRFTISGRSMVSKLISINIVD